MANVSSFIEPKFLNGEALGQTPQILTIKSASVDTLGDDGKEKVIVEFYEQEKPLPCNVTQLRSLIDLFGPETKVWPNNQVMAYGEKLAIGKFAGKYTIRITAPPKQAAQQVKPAQPEEQASQSAPPAEQDEIPF